MAVLPQLLGLLPQDARERLALGAGRLCLSGAAKGADACWSGLAWERGDAVVHWSFAGHRRAACLGEAVELAPAALTQADEHLALAARSLGRRWPPRSSYSANLLRRDYFQVAWSDAVYAVSGFGQDGEISGGTAWTVRMFLDRFLEGDCPAYLFDQDRGCWLAWRQRRWLPIGRPPAPEGIWAGVGTRDLGARGIAAIEGLMQGRPD